ncbi:hypothetical protein [Winogradskyella sediminis]|uniref:hypothetical protein n=1 Tax=Winogradskyella sediminis TaxID=1382466 RepID=UPI000E24B637|nr:hypothetical protein [Winogradskyella sediminis]REG89790.1 hypothetical protein C8N41_1011035 [Winogradskyella sediminis]
MKSIIIAIFILFINTAFAQVGINTTDPKSTLDINGNLSVKVVEYNGGPGWAATPIDDGVYINLVPTASNVEFILPDASLVPGRIYILRNISDAENAVIYTFGADATSGAGVEFYRGDGRNSQGPLGSVIMTADIDNNGGDITKTLIFISDGANWTYGHIGL